MVTIWRGTAQAARVTAVAAIASGGATMAPSAKAAAHVMPEDEGVRPPWPLRTGRDDDQADRQRADGAEIRPEVLDWRVERRDVEQRRQDDEEDQIGIDLDPGHPGTRPRTGPPMTRKIG